MCSYEIILTWDCNLQCVYCYECKAEKSTQELRKTNKQPISPDRINEIIEFIIETHDKNAREITIIFWGGEPFLAFDQMKELIERLEQAQIENKIKPELSYTTTSNLTVTTLEQMQYLKTKKFSILVSLDGLEDTTDKNRGKGTFAKTIRNMALLHGLRIPFKIRMTVSPKRAVSIKEDFEFVNSLGYAFWWNVDHTDEPLAENNVRQLLNGLRCFYRQYPQSNDKTLDRYFMPKHGRHCIDPYQQVTIDPEGYLRVCSRVDWIIGTISEGITKYAEIKDAPFYSKNHVEKCKYCSTLEYCGGGCLGVHLEKTPKSIIKYQPNKSLCNESFLIQLLNEYLVLDVQYAELKNTEGQ